MIQTPTTTTASTGCTTGYTTYTIPAGNTSTLQYGLGQLGSNSATGTQMQQGLPGINWEEYTRHLAQQQMHQQFMELLMRGSTTFKTAPPAKPLATKALTAEDREALEGELPF